MDETSQKIVVVDLRIPFFRLVLFLVKLSLAAIPAAIILGLIGFAVSAILATLFGGHMDVMMRRWNM
ncbi:hypothetical protein A33M_0003 [Rhodovulum sp. PH10]|uniref:hypothetical protein n=1 Tax=Rhodovulum sp. PH10 TaxID=1187851 RepID=UPI00027C2444|nr:hypothetical protein [Rhodovulum sp. PH10]EJW13673.1 hypothetical protein A33M_0003 [Rhodovulum sp. PH10]